MLRDGEADSVNIARVMQKPFSPRALLVEVLELLNPSQIQSASQAA